LFVLERRAIVAAILLVLATVSFGCGPEPPSPEATPLGLQPDVARAAKEKVSASTGVSVEEIEIVRANRVEWSDTCLELGGTDEFCGQAITPGWRVILRADGEEYEIHTDLGADTVRLKQE
jgi:hypothetical protein